MLKTAVAILNYNGKGWLEKFLPSLTNYSQIADIYVIDNQSNDDSISFLKENYPTIKIVINDQNYGFAKGYNEGLKNIEADIFCLLNSDVEVTENWIESVLEVFQSNENIAAVQPKILSYHQKEYFEFAGAAGGLIDNLGYPYCRGRVFENIEKDLGQYDDLSEIFWASGCALFIRSSVFWEQNGFDERYFAHQEEIDLCWRIINSGKKVYYTYKSKVYHVGGATLNKNNPQKTYLNIRNNLSTLLKNLPFPKLIGLIFIRLCLDGVAGIYFGLKMGFPHLWAVVRAHFGFYAQLPGTWKRRGKNQIKNYYQTKGLIFQHYLKK